MSRPLHLLPRLRLAALAGFTALALAGCNGDSYETSARSRQPLSPKTVALIEEKGMTTQSPILVRIYKQEAELEVWKEKKDGEFALLKTYPICRWSGDLGPKVRTGDRQAPEGFYTITPGQMNPNSSYYLSFNLGFPNAYDRAYGRSGDFLMVHGDCSSAGCYSMTDEQIAEIYALGRESFVGGQKSFQVQALPFRMTPTNLAKYRNNPNMPFWKNLKEGTDAFDVTLREPKVNVCNRRYVFNGTPDPGRGFDASLACPNYTVPAEIARAISAKERADDAKVAELIASTPTPSSRAGIDGGMHPIFLAKFKELNPAFADGPIVAAATPPGTMPAKTTNPPRVADDGFSPQGSGSHSVVAVASAPAPAATSVAVGPTPAASSGGASGFSLSNVLGFNKPNGASDPVGSAARPGSPADKTKTASLSSETAAPPAPISGTNSIMGTESFSSAR